MSAEWIKTAKVGDKVVCVDDVNRTIRIDDGFVERPVSGVVYTIRDIVVGKSSEGPDIGFRLVEIVNQPHDYDDLFDRKVFVEVSFKASRFRPIAPRKTDISIFTDMLKSVGKPVKETV